VSDAKLVRFPDKRYGVLVLEAYQGRPAKFACLKDYSKTYHQKQINKIDDHCKGRIEEARECLAKVNSDDLLGYEVVE
jgi:hypothetical protein